MRCITRLYPRPGNRSQKLGAPVEQLGERLRTRVGVEAVLLFDRHPWQLATLPGELVARPRELLLARQQLLSGGVALLARTGPRLVTARHMMSHPLSRCRPR